jgi:hypothetical protein
VCRDYDDDRSWDKDRDRDRDRDKDRDRDRDRSFGENSRSNSSSSLTSLNTPVQPAQLPAAATPGAQPPVVQKTVLTQNPFTGNWKFFLYTGTDFLKSQII